MSKPKIKGKWAKKLEKMFAPAPTAEMNEMHFGVVGAVASQGAPYSAPLRVFMERNNVVMFLSAKEARKLAAFFDASPDKNGVPIEIPEALRDLAAECDIRNGGPTGSA